MTYSYRVYPVVSVDIIACFIVFSEVVVSACVVLSVVLLVTCFNDVLVHGFICVQ